MEWNPARSKMIELSRFDSLFTLDALAMRVCLPKTRKSEITWIKRLQFPDHFTRIPISFDRVELHPRIHSGKTSWNLNDSMVNDCGRSFVVDVVVANVGCRFNHIRLPLLAVPLFDSLSPSVSNRKTIHRRKIPLLISLFQGRKFHTVVQVGIHRIGFLSSAIDHILFTASFLVHNFCFECEMKCCSSTPGKLSIPTLRLKGNCTQIRFDRCFNIWRVMMW